MERTKQDYHNLLDETIQYYSQNKNLRAIDDNENCYYHFDGKKCAVGRCLNDPDMVEKTLNGKGVDSGVTNLFEYFNPDDIFLEKYRNYDINFWMVLQMLHDKNINWNEDGLSEIGLKFTNDIKNAIDIGQY